MNGMGLVFVYRVKAIVTKPTQTKDLRMSKKLKVYKMNDCDWWADYSAEEAEKNYASFVRSQCDVQGEPDEATLLSDEELLSHTFHDEEAGITASFKVQLDKLDKPQFFASTEY